MAGLESLTLEHRSVLVDLLCKECPDPLQPLRLEPEGSKKKRSSSSSAAQSSQNNEQVNVCNHPEAAKMASEVSVCNHPVAAKMASEVNPSYLDSDGEDEKPRLKRLKRASFGQSSLRS